MRHQLWMFLCVGLDSHLALWTSISKGLMIRDEKPISVLCACVVVGCGGFSYPLLLQSQAGSNHRLVTDPHWCAETAVLSSTCCVLLMGKEVRDCVSPTSIQTSGCRPLLTNTCHPETSHCMDCQVPVIGLTPAAPATKERPSPSPWHEKHLVQFLYKHLLFLGKPGSAAVQVAVGRPREQSQDPERLCIRRFVEVLPCLSRLKFNGYRAGCQILTCLPTLHSQSHIVSFWGLGIIQQLGTVAWVPCPISSCLYLPGQQHLLSWCVLGLIWLLLIEERQQKTSFMQSRG